MAAPSDLILYDGQYDWRRGMDSSLAPLVSDPTSVRLGINVTFRGGRAKTRPGFQQIFLTDDPDYPGSLALYSTGRNSSNVKTGNYFQGAFFYVNKTDPTKSCLIACSGGYVFRIRPVEGFVACPCRNTRCSTPAELSVGTPPAKSTFVRRKSFSSSRTELTSR